MNYFRILAAFGRYGDLVLAETAAVPELIQFYNDIQAWIGKHPKIIADLPEVGQAIGELEAILAKHKELIAQEEKLTPRMQQLVAELLPIIQRVARPALERRASRTDRGLEPKKSDDLPLVGRPQNSLGSWPPPSMEHHMSEPTTSAGHAPPPATEDQAIRQRVKGITSQVLQQGRVDPEAVRDVVRAAISGTPDNAAASRTEVRELFADAVRGLDEALVKSTSATHGALQQLASRGKDFTDSDLKEALVSLRRLEEDYLAVANRITNAMSSSLRREMRELAVHAQKVGVEASAGVANMVGQLASGMNPASGLATMRGATVRMTMLASGVLAGVADALGGQSEAKQGN
jgi:hypothetical protein